MNPLREKSWPPLAVGTGIGALSAFACATAKRPIGVTTPFESAAVLGARRIAPRLFRVNEYAKEVEEPPRVDWEAMLVLGIPLGAYLSARLSGDRGDRGVPELWRARVGPSAVGRYAGAFLGGALMMFGARLARGCTSGHGISGTLQLAASSWIFNPIFMGTGIAVARAMAGGRRISGGRASHAA